MIKESCVCGGSIEYPSHQPPPPEIIDWRIDHSGCEGGLSGYVEIVETRSQRATNVYLKGGYHLISTGIVHLQRKDHTERSQQYVLGRSADVVALKLDDVIKGLPGPKPHYDGADSAPISVSDITWPSTGITLETIND